MVRHKAAIVLVVSIMTLTMISLVLDPAGYRTSAPQDFRSLENVQVSDSFLDQLRCGLKYDQVDYSDFYAEHTEVSRANGIWIVRGCIDEAVSSAREGEMTLHMRGGKEWDLPENYSFDPGKGFEARCQEAYYRRIPVQIAFVERAGSGYEMIDAQLLEKETGNQPDMSFIFET